MALNVCPSWKETFLSEQKLSLGPKCRKKISSLLSTELNNRALVPESINRHHPEGNLPVRFL